MARKATITRQMLIDGGVDLVLCQGIHALNARALAAHLGCSIQPIFRNFGSMDALRAEIRVWLDAAYQRETAKVINKRDYMFTISLAHILLAQDHRHLFEAMFLSGLFANRTVAEVIASPWNRETIECAAVQYGVSIAKSEELYRDVRFYTFGIAQAVFAGAILLHEGEAEELLRGAIKSFLGQDTGR